jgi:hypothetical protein
MYIKFTLLIPSRYLTPKIQKKYECTVVRNPGVGGPWGFGQILFREVLGAVKKSRGSPFRVLLHFLSQFFGLYPPPCMHLCKKYQSWSQTFDTRNSKKYWSWSRRSIPETQKRISLSLNVR